MHGGRLGGDQALGSCSRRTRLSKLGSAARDRHDGAGTSTPWSHDFAAPPKNTVTIAGISDRRFCSERTASSQSTFERIGLAWPRPAPFRVSGDGFELYPDAIHASAGRRGEPGGAAGP